MCTSISSALPADTKLPSIDIEMSYTNMFAAEPKKGLFGEVKSGHVVSAIESWLVSKDIKTSAKRINFILNGLPVHKIGVPQISDVGEHHVNEASEANRCVDSVVTDFAALKGLLDEPKTLVLEALDIIQDTEKPRWPLGFLRGSRQRNPTIVRAQVKDKTQEALNLFKTRAQYHLIPFIAGLDGAKLTLETIAVDLDNTINALNYLIDNTEDQTVKDFAYRRKEMFVKSLALMQMNLGQMKSMSEICEKNKLFISELEMTVLPIIENVMRTGIISGDDNLDDIASALRGIL